MRVTEYTINQLYKLKAVIMVIFRCTKISYTPKYPISNSPYIKVITEVHCVDTGYKRSDDTIYV